jgi:hypothetical protein
MTAWPPFAPRALAGGARGGGDERPSRGKAREPIRKSESFRIRPQAPWGLCPQTPGIFRGMAPNINLLLAYQRSTTMITAG